MLYFKDSFIDELIKEDVPYIDLTTMILDIGNKKGILEFRFREDGVVACAEEAARVFEKLGIKVVFCLSSGTIVNKGGLVLSGEGDAQALHMAWKICLNILEYCSGIATRSKVLVDKAKSINPNLSVVFTRKSFPGTKQLVAKSAISGGMLPHRLGISETVLVFKQHLNFIGGIDALTEKLREIKLESCEKKIIVEADNLSDALKLASNGVDGIQLDKIPHEDLAEYVKKIKGINSQIALIATGGIRPDNISEYAKTQVDAIATSAVFHGKPLDIEARINPI